jgi:hypothetical protein
MMIARGLGQTSTFADGPALLAYCQANPTAEASYAPAGQSPAQTLACSEWPSIIPATNVTSECPSAEQLAGIVDPLDPCQAGTGTTISTSISSTTLIVGGLALVALYFLMGRK